jgi:aminotransferase in exopolysaccharide biosynthesis
MEGSFIPLSVPNLKGNELKYVTNAVESEWVSTAGPYVKDFEAAVAQYVHAKGAVSCQNGTAGLHISLLLCGVTRDDAVLVPALTFIAAVNPVIYIGAEPIFMDCDDSLCMDPDKVEAFCETECDFIDGKLIDRQTRRHVKALLVVHVFGNMADMDRILEVASKYGLKVVEDSTEAIGTYYKQGRYAGKYAGTMGDVGVFSFNGNKIITTGGGGMIVSDNEEYLKKAKHLTTQAKSDELNFLHDEIGYNYRLTNLQAALGLAQMEQLEGFIETKIRNYGIYKEKISKIAGLRLLGFRKETRSNHWFYSVFCEDSFGMDRDSLVEYLAGKSIQARPIWGLINEQNPYVGSQEYRIEKAKYYWERVVNIPCSTNLENDGVKRVIAALEHNV